MNVCIPQIQAEDIASHAEEEELITCSPPHPGQYILKPFCIRILLLLLLCGSLPSTPLVWASLVTGATGRGVTFPQKSSALNKSPNIAGDFISFTLAGSSKRSSSSLQKTKKRRKWPHNGPLAACKSSFAATWLGPLLISSPLLSSISPFPRRLCNPDGLQIFPSLMLLPLSQCLFLNHAIKPRFDALMLINWAATQDHHTRRSFGEDFHHHTCNF